MNRTEYTKVFPELSAGHLFELGDLVATRRRYTLELCDAMEITGILGGKGEDTTYEVIFPTKSHGRGKRTGTRKQRNLMLVVSVTEPPFRPLVSYVWVHFGGDKNPEYLSFMLCPFCKQIHQHGASALGGGGHRGAHCGGAYLGEDLADTFYQTPPIRKYSALKWDDPKDWVLTQFNRKSSHKKPFDRRSSRSMSAAL